MVKSKAPQQAVAEAGPCLLQQWKEKRLLQLNSSPFFSSLWCVSPHMDIMILHMFNGPRPDVQARTDVHGRKNLYITRVYMNPKRGENSQSPKIDTCTISIKEGTRLHLGHNHPHNDVTLGIYHCSLSLEG